MEQTEESKMTVDEFLQIVKSHYRSEDEEHPLDDEIEVPQDMLPFNYSFSSLILDEYRDFDREPIPTDKIAVYVTIDYQDEYTTEQHELIVSHDVFIEGVFDQLENCIMDKFNPSENRKIQNPNMKE